MLIFSLFIKLMKIQKQQRSYGNALKPNQSYPQLSVGREVFPIFILVEL